MIHIHEAKKSRLIHAIVCAYLAALPTTSQAQTPCENPVVIDFEEVPAGTKVTDQLSASGVGLVSTLNATPGDPDIALIFDSSNPTGGDDDLGTPNEDFDGPGAGEGEGNTVPLGNILIVAEDDDDEDGDGLVDDPDDSARGGDILFNFTVPSTVLSVKLVDVETRGVTIAGFSGSDTETFAVEVEGTTGNSVQTVNLSSVTQSPSERMIVTLRESSAIGEVTICPQSAQLVRRRVHISSACTQSVRGRAQRIGKRRLRRMGKKLRRYLSEHGKASLRKGQC